MEDKIVITITPLAEVTAEVFESNPAAVPYVQEFADKVVAHIKKIVVAPDIPEIPKQK